MHRLYWVVLLIAALATAAVGQMNDMHHGKPKAKMSAKAATEKKLLEMEKSLWEAWKNHDPAPFQKMLSADSVNVTPTGVAGTEQAAKEVGASDCKVNSYSLDDPKATWIDKDAVLLTYKATQDAVCGGQKPLDTVWASSLWVKKGTEWKAAFHQETTAQSGMGAEEKKN